MLSSKLTFVINLLALLFFLAVIAMQLLEFQSYTGSLFGFLS